MQIFEVEILLLHYSLLFSRMSIYHISFYIIPGILHKIMLFILEFFSFSHKFCLMILLTIWQNMFLSFFMSIFCLLLTSHHFSLINYDFRDKILCRSTKYITTFYFLLSAFYSLPSNARKDANIISPAFVVSCPRLQYC